MFTITQILLHKIMHSDNADEYLIYHYTFEKVSNVEVFILFREVGEWLTYSLRAGFGMDFYCFTAFYSFDMAFLLLFESCTDWIRLRR